MRPSLRRTFQGVMAEPAELLSAIATRNDLLRLWVHLTLIMIGCGATYGAVLGWWTGPRLAVYVAVKLPLVLLITSALTMALSWVGASLLGLRLSLGQVATLTFVALARASLLLASLAPAAWLFTLCAPAPSLAARLTHNALYLMHTALVGACGLTGTRLLWGALTRFEAPRRTLRSVYLLWVLSFALVGGEVAWALRPFVGSIYLPVAFVREDALDGNVYEFVFTDILPYMARKLDD